MDRSRVTLGLLALAALVMGVWRYFPREGTSEGVTVLTVLFNGDPTNPAVPEYPVFKAWWDLMQKYETVKGNVKVERHYVPMSTDEATFMVTRFSSGMTPDIWNSHSGVIEDNLSRNWFHPLTGLLTRPTPYSNGRPWIEAWPKGTFEMAKLSDGNIYSVSLCGGPLGDAGPSIGFFYNRELFAKVGQKRPPETWAELMQLCKRLKEAGIVPHYYNNEAWWQITWTLHMVGEQLTAPLVPEVDLDGDGNVSRKELVRAAWTGVYRATHPGVRETLRIARTWSEYFQPHFLAKSPVNLFRRGMTAMMTDGPWMVYQLDRDPNVKFKWGTFQWPKVTRETTALAPEAPYIPTLHRTGAGTRMGSAWSIPYTTARDPKKLPTAIDFLQFMTCLESQHYFGSTQPIPVLQRGQTIEELIPDAERREQLLGLLYAMKLRSEGKEVPYVRIPFLGYVSDYMPLLHSYLTDEMTVDEFCKRADEQALRDLAVEIERRGWQNEPWVKERLR